MSHYAIVFLAGIAGSMHCAGMCGGFACALGADSSGRAATLVRHLTYNLGRITSYCFLGTLVGYLGVLLVGHGGDGAWASNAQRALAVFSGLLMLYIGLQFLGLFRRPTPALPGVAWLADGLRQIVRRPGLAAPLALGVINGLLPCPLVYALLAHAAVSGGPLPGLLVMGAFGLGTFPAMLVMGGFALWIRLLGTRGGGKRAHPGGYARGGPALPADWRLQGVRIAGGFILLLGLVTLARGLLPMGGHLHGL
jgi:sulfite exporter TauE/SafE